MEPTTSVKRARALTAKHGQVVKNYNAKGQQRTQNKRLWQSPHSTPINRLSMESRQRGDAVPGDHSEKSRPCENGEREIPEDCNFLALISARYGALRRLIQQRQRKNTRIRDVSEATCRAKPHLRKMRFEIPGLEPRLAARPASTGKPHVHGCTRSNADVMPTLGSLPHIVLFDGFSFETKKTTHESS